MSENIRADPAAPQQIVCAWCVKILRRGTLPASHAICTDCKAKVNRELDAEDESCRP